MSIRKVRNSIGAGLLGFGICAMAGASAPVMFIAIAGGVAAGYVLTA